MYTVRVYLLQVSCIIADLSSLYSVERLNSAARRTENSAAQPPVNPVKSAGPKMTRDEYRNRISSALLRQLSMFDCFFYFLHRTDIWIIDQFLPQAKKFPYTHFLSSAVANHLRVINWPLNIPSLGPNFSLNSIKAGKGGPFETLIDALSLRVIEDDSVIEAPHQRQVPQVQIQQWSQGAFFYSCMISLLMYLEQRKWHIHLIHPSIPEFRWWSVLMDRF